MNTAALRCFFIWCLGIVLCLTLAACDGEEDDTTTTTTTAAVVSSTTTSAATTTSTAAATTTTTTIIPIALTTTTTSTTSSTTTIGSYSCTDPIRLDGPPADLDSQNPEVAVDGSGIAYAVWADERGGTSRIYFSYRPLGGAWQENELVSDSAASADNPDIAVSSAGTVFVVWRDMRSGDSDIYFSRRSLDGTWLTNVRVDNAPEGSSANDPAIAVDNSGTMYVVWEDYRTDAYCDVWFSESSAGGTWSSDVQLDDAPASVQAAEPDIAATHDGTIHVVWHDNRPSGHYMFYDIYHRYRPAGGSWTSTAQVNTTTDTGYCKYPSIALSAEGNAYCVWQYYDTDHFDIYYALRMFDGFWSPDERVNDTPDDDDAENPRIALDSSGKPYVFWEDYRTGKCKPRFSYRSGKGWAASTEVLGDDLYEEYETSYYFTPDFEHPSLGVSPTGDAHVVWHDDRYGDYDIHSNYRPAGGTWQDDARVDQPPPKDAQATYPAVAVMPSGYPCALWQDTRNGSPDMYFSWSSRPTVSWEPNEMVDDNDEGDYAMFPDIAVDSEGTAHAVWQDHRSGDWQIYYARRPDEEAWQADERIDDSSSGTDANSPVIALDAGGTAYAVWKDGRDGDSGIYFSLRPEGETSVWQTNERINDPAGTSLYASSAAVAADADGNCYAVWVDMRGGDYDIYGAYRPADGSWQADERVDDDTSGSSATFPAVAIDGEGTAHVLWSDTRNGGNDLYYSFRPAGGTWQAAELVNSDGPGGSCYFPAIAADVSGNLFAVWKDSRHSYDPDIQFSFRPAGGEWQDSQQIDIRVSGWNDVNNPDIGISASAYVSIVYQEDYQYPLSSWDVMYSLCAPE